MRMHRVLIAIGVVPGMLAMSQPASQPGQSARPGAATPARQPKLTPGTPKRNAQEDQAAAVSEGLMAQEQAVWETLKSGNSERFASVLAEDFVEITGHGLENKAQTVEEVKKLKLVSYTLTNWRVIELNEDAAIVLYKAEQEWTDATGKADRATSYCASTWRHSGGRWLAVSHQENDQKPAAENAEHKSQGKPTDK